MSKKIELSVEDKAVVASGNLNIKELSIRISAVEDFVTGYVANKYNVKDPAILSTLINTGEYSEPESESEIQSADTKLQPKLVD